MLLGGGVDKALSGREDDERAVYAGPPRLDTEITMGRGHSVCGEGVKMYLSNVQFR